MASTNTIDSIRPMRLNSSEGKCFLPFYDYSRPVYECQCFFFSGGKANEEGTYGENLGPDTIEGYTRGDHTAEVDAAEVDDEIRDEEIKSEEPDDGEDLDDRVDE